MSPLKALRSKIHELYQDSRGGTAVLLAAAAIPTVLAGGLAVDSARGYLVKSHLTSALDAAALAGGKTLSGTPQEIAAVVQMYIDANFPVEYLGAKVIVPEVNVSADGNKITISARAIVNTSFLAVGGFDTMDVRAESEVTRRLTGMELVLVMDNTGSMRGNDKIGTMKDAATDLVEILYGANETLENFWVSLVPFTATVNIGPNREGWLANYDPAMFDLTGGYDVNFISWKGCVEARAAPFDQTDAPPATALWPVYYWPSTEPMYGSSGDNSWEFDDFDESAATNTSSNDGTGPNVGCPPPITSLTAEKTTVVDAIDDMGAWHRGGTMGNLGLVWGWRVLSPQWRGLWGGDTPDTLPLDYNSENMQKVVVMLTDGENNWYDWPGGLPNNPSADYNAYRRPEDGLLGTTDKNAAKAIINARLTAACTAMKDQGVLIYTITFQVNSSTIRDLYEDCATSVEHYYNSPTNAQLADVFQAIGEELAELRISR